ncbi:MAG: lspA [Caulobacter sp.]|nr:lspA [Caulobacter sp.]
MAAKNSNRALLTFVLAAVVIIADQALKAWLLGPFHLAARGTAPLIGPLQLTLVQNPGVSFGLFRADADWGRWALAAFSGGVALFLGIWALRVTRPLLAVALGLVMGGAVGNLIDRVRWGTVVDFIDIRGLMFPWVFNIADSAITIGVVFLLLDSLRREVPSHPLEDAAS